MGDEVNGGRDEYEKVRFIIEERGGERVTAIARVITRVIAMATATATASIMIAMIFMSVISNDQMIMRGKYL